jgi:hypothetical protein
MDAAEVQMYNIYSDAACMYDDGERPMDVLYCTRARKIRLKIIMS